MEFLGGAVIVPEEEVRTGRQEISTAPRRHTVTPAPEDDPLTRRHLPFAPLAAAALLAPAAPARADSPLPPSSYRQPAPGGAFVFVMIAPVPAEKDGAHWIEEKAAEIREVRRTYPRTGMYRADGPAEPLWTADWYAYSVHPAADGVHLVRPGPWAWLGEDRQPDLDCPAVSFYAAGRLLRTYRVGDLVDAPGTLEQSVSHYEWREEMRPSGEFEYTIATADGNRFVFDIRTGEIVSEARGARLGRGVWWAALGLAAAAAVGWLVFRRFRPARPA